MPWKNGGGITTQIALSQNQPLFHWRASRAQVASSGPFSCFTGYDRILFLLQGDEGIILNFKDRTVILDKQLSMVKFMGEEPCQADISKPITDWNWMTLRSEGVGDANVISQAGDQMEATVIYAVDSSKVSQIGN